MHVSQTMLWLCDYTPVWLQQCNKLMLHKCPEQYLTAQKYLGPILGFRPANERRRYKVTPSLIGWAQT